MQNDDWRRVSVLMKGKKQFLKERKWYDRWLRKPDNSSRRVSLRTHRLNSARFMQQLEERI